MKMRSLIFAAYFVVAGVVQSAVTHACGFENPQAIALGTLNLKYPDAVHVLAAVWRAEDAGFLIPRRGRADGAGSFAFYRAASVVKKLGVNLADSLPAETGMAISVVLIPQVMWTRLEVGPDGLTVQSHAGGPRDGDLVIVTEEKVIRELVDRKLDSGTAEITGLLRFYGDPEEIANVRAALAKTDQAERTPSFAFAGR
ncbi:hypothetical protein G6N74_28345 [Mesorhizobium sp. CGMCC 1.15528]|uniref:Uncharacterized protein n=1 Tax=Mesorhizobium zhangyense TaxID=1776730 RepID=A0A7C9VI67_9HYPH|nr:hypothetical protein [Mesorhizobium zhangyense]NGN44971.1 hypothetical protein [Mesorhizobium zhangyense]